MANVVQERYAGNFVFKDIHANVGHRLRLVDAIGPDVVKYISDFVAEPVDLTSGEYDPRWTITRVEAGAGESTFGPLDGSGGIGRITTDANDNDGINAQLRGESFKLAAGNIVYFGAKVRMSEATQSDFFLGLAITDTDILGGVTDSIGFDKVDGATAVKAFVNKNTTRTEVTPVLTQDADTWHILEFYFDGPRGTVKFFVDGVETTRLASWANIPNDEELRVTFQGLSGSAGAKTFDLDWIRCIQIGRN